MRTFRERTFGEGIINKDGTWAMENIPSMLARSAFYYAQSAGKFFCNHEYIVDRENYNTILLVYCINGNGKLVYRNKTYVVGKGQAFIIDCCERHIYSTYKDNWEFVWVHFNGSESRSYVINILENNGPIIAINEDSIIPNRIEKIQELMQIKNIRNDITIAKMLLEILTEAILSSFNTGKDSDIIPSFVNKAIRIIEKEYKTPLSLEAVSNRLNISKYHMSREFKKYTGYSPYEYIIHYRLNYSKSLLKTTELTISEIADASGFESVSHFIKTFKSHENLTPLQYRKYW